MLSKSHFPLPSPLSPLVLCAYSVVKEIGEVGLYLSSAMNSSDVVHVANIRSNRQWHIGSSSNDNKSVPQGPALIPAHFTPPTMLVGAVKYRNTRPSAYLMGQGWYRQLCMRCGALPDAGCIDFGTCYSHNTSFGWICVKSSKHCLRRLICAAQAGSFIPR